MRAWGNSARITESLAGAAPFAQRRGPSSHNAGIAASTRPVVQCGIGRKNGEPDLSSAGTISPIYKGDYPGAGVVWKSVRWMARQVVSGLRALRVISTFSRPFERTIVPMVVGGEERDDRTRTMITSLVASSAKRPKRHARARRRSAASATKYNDSRT